MDKIYWGESPAIAEFDREKFAEFLERSPLELKKTCSDEEGRLKHVIKAEHFDLSFLELVCETAHAIRKVAKLKDNFLQELLKASSILNYFHQPSTRTFLSFSAAEARLGMRREEVRDPRTSSYAKGESEKDALRTISSYFDAMVCRHPSDVYDLFAVWVMGNSDREIPIINAGSGTKEHPTQGILDYYTLSESFRGDLDGKVIAYVGDCLRGRTVHSLARIMSLHQDITAHFLAPKELQIDTETENYLKERATKVIKSSSPLAEIVPEVDVVYMTRIQDEHGGQGGYDQKFIFTEEMLGLMKLGAILMHPMPKREEISPALDYFHQDHQIMYWRQQRNGMWVRAALLAYLFKVDDRIRDRYKKIRGAF